jgi:hypothetical protein
MSDMQNAPPQLARRIVWFGIFAAIPMYYVVMRMVPPEAPSADPTLPNILVPLSVVLAGLSIPIRKLVARSKPIPAFVLALILCEIAALCGLVLWFTTGSPRSYYCLAAGALGMLLHFPRATQPGANPA